jgi:hypothetical protein
MLLILFSYILTGSSMDGRRAFSRAGGTRLSGQRRLAAGLGSVRRHRRHFGNGDGAKPLVVIAVVQVVRYAVDHHCEGSSEKKG